MLRTLGLVILTEAEYLEATTEAHKSGRTEGHANAVDHANHAWVEALAHPHKNFFDAWAAAPTPVLIQAQRVVDAYQEGV